MLPSSIFFNGPMSKHSKYYKDPNIISAEAVFDNTTDLYDDNSLFISIDTDKKYVHFSFDLRNSKTGEFKRHFPDYSQNNNFTIENNKLIVNISNTIFDVVFNPNENVDNGYKPNVCNFILGKKALKQLKKFINSNIN